VTRIAPP